MSLVPKSEDKKFVLQMMHSIQSPIITWVGYEDSVTEEQKNTYRHETLLHNKEIFEKEEAPDYHVILYLSTASLAAVPSLVFTKLYLQLSKKFFGDKIDFVTEEKLELHEERELLKLKKWIFKKQIEYLKQKSKGEKI